MGDKTGIAWTDATWNPVRGCSRVSPGCVNCYAERQAIRMSCAGGAYEGLVRTSKHGPTWTGKVRLVPELLDQPLRWTKPRRVFVNSMSDLFHEGLTNEEIAAVFGVMAASPRHTFQVLTKRARRMREWFEWVASVRTGMQTIPTSASLTCAYHAQGYVAQRWSVHSQAWPLPNVWLGVSAEDQQRADERIPDLLATPAAVRFVSYEPALGPVVFRALRPVVQPGCKLPTLDWIIVGGESGPGARPFDVAWARAVVRQCKAARVACFVKQMGAHAFEMFPPQRYPDDPSRWHAQMIRRCDTFTGKGGDPAEWPEDLRVREFPWP